MCAPPSFAPCPRSTHSFNLSVCVSVSSPPSPPPLSLSTALLLPLSFLHRPSLPVLCPPDMSEPQVAAAGNERAISAITHTLNHDPVPRVRAAAAAALRALCTYRHALVDSVVHRLVDVVACGAEHAEVRDEAAKTLEEVALPSHLMAWEELRKWNETHSAR